MPKTASESQRAGRLELIRNTIRAVVQSYKPTIAVLEQYAFSAVHSQAHSAGELGGVVKVMLHEHKIQIEVVSPASARRLLGRQPRKDAKVWAATRLYAAGCPRLWTLDQVDAFVCANWILAEHGKGLLLNEAA